MGWGEYALAFGLAYSALSLAVLASFIGAAGRAPRPISRPGACLRPTLGGGSRRRCEAWNVFANDPERVRSISDRAYERTVNL
ncbi:hypothetical protein RA2_03759 [Roseovarius sp. A-2]|nr:hypothetical protein RA2_03759 [Roseovarius sp. A-2]